MITVQNHIKELLFEQDCVVIPDFGGFLTNFDGAKINDSKQFISPPQKWLAFNALLKNDDGLLSNYIAKEENISREQASLKVKSFVEETKRYIQFDNSYFMEGLGTFSQNEENKIQFQPKVSTNFYTESFGLENIRLKKSSALPNELQVVHTPPAVSNHTIQQVFVADDREPMAELMEDETVAPYSRRRFSRVLPVVYGLFGAAFLMSAIYFYDNQKVSLSSMNPFQSSAVTQPIVKKAIIETPKAVEKVETKPFEPVVAENIVETKKTINSSNNRFFIILGSFGSEQNAKKLVRTLKNKGYEEAKLIYPKNNEKLIKVTAGGFQNEFEADKQAVQISEAISQATWIYEQK
jgi:cell division septation protein DedD/nucleoid DNA-binding protein